MNQYDIIAAGTGKMKRTYESTLIGFGVQGPDHGNCDYVGDSENVEGFLADCGEHYWAEECLFQFRQSHFDNSGRLRSRRDGEEGGRELTSHPFPILHPTTPHAFPLARPSSGKISAGYNHGTVSQVAPNTNVKMKTKLAAAAPYCEALVASPASEALMARRDIPPARNIAMP